MQKFRTLYDNQGYQDPEYVPGISKTVQYADVDTPMSLMQRHLAGDVNAMSLKSMEYNDLTKVPSLPEMLMMTRQADEDFAQLSARQREYFGNDPGRFLAAFDGLTDKSEHYPDLVRIGLINAKQEPPKEPPKVEPSKA